MRRIVVTVLTLLLVPLAALVAPAQAQADDPVRILVYGDSMTQGSSGDWTWRYFLDRHLHDSGVRFDLVGPRGGVHHVPEASGTSFPDESTYADPGFDPDHAAVWGQSLTDPTYDLAALGASYIPDVVVAMIGFNDVTWGGWTPAALAERWRSEIAALRTASPGVAVVLVQVPESWKPGIAAYDDMLVDLATELDEPGARVVATERASFVREVDTWDDTHPTASGEVKIAVAVENALARVGVGHDAGMIPVAVNGPRLAATLSASAGIGVVSLSWQDRPGITQEWLERRDATVGGRWDRYPIPFAAGTVSWSADGLTDGHRYEFRLRPAKGAAISDDLTSAVVSVVPGPRPGPPVVRAVTADAGGRLQATWTAPANATAYAVMLRDATRGEPWRDAATTTGTGWSVGGLVSAHRYELRVRADNGIIVGATSATGSAVVPLVAPVAGVTARSPRRDHVRTTAATVPFATGYRLLAAPARSCAHVPRVRVFRHARGDLARPATTVRTRSRALWVRWLAVRDGVPGEGGPGSTTCTRVR